MILTKISQLFSFSVSEHCLLQYSQAIKNIFPNWIEFNAVITTGIILTDLIAERSHARRRSSLTLRADHLTLEWGGGGRCGWFWKKISFKRLSEEKNCMQHKCNRKLIGKKGKKYPAHQITRKQNSWWPEITHSPPPPHPSRVKWSAP